MMRHLRSLPILAFVMLCLLPAVAVADAPWRTSQPAFGPTIGANAWWAGLAFTPAGHGVALVSSNGPAGTQGVLATIAPDGAVGVPTPVPGWPDAYTTYGEDGLAVGRYAQSGLHISLGMLGEPPTDLELGPEAFRLFSLVGNRRGDLAVLTGSTVSDTPGGDFFHVFRTFLLWMRDRGSGPLRLVRRLTLAARPVVHALALGPTGDMVLAYSRWAHPRALYARRISRAGSMGRDLALGPMAAENHVEADLAADGRLVLAWQAPRKRAHASEGETPPPSLLKVAAARRSGGFARPVTLDSTAYPYLPASLRFRTMRMLPTGASSEVLAWTSVSGEGYEVKAVAIDHNRPRSVQRLTPAGSFSLSDMAASTSGAAVVLFSSGTTSPPGALRATSRAAGAARFSAPELIDAAGLEASVALDPLTGSAFVAYSQGSQGGALALAVRPPATP